MSLSFFDERRGVVVANFEWGQWWQTVQELHLKIKIPPGTKSRQIEFQVKPKYIRVSVAGNLIFEGPLSRTVRSDETVWTLEDGYLCAVLSNASYSIRGDEMWEYLLEGGGFQPDTATLMEMRKNLDLERFQIENPGMDFSRAQLQKCYDAVPGLPKDHLQKESKDSN